MLRFVSPVRSFARIATTDTVIRGKQIRAGEGVVLFYGSANRDEEVFGADSDAFDVDARERAAPDRVRASANISVSVPRSRGSRRA
jgi:cytochrome P450